MQMSYWRFAAMIATSTLVMFGLMYLKPTPSRMSAGAKHGFGWRS